MTIKFSLNRISFASARKRGLYFCMRHYRLLFSLLFLGLTGFLMYQWNRDLYRYQWTESERRAYLETTAKETAFQEKKFLEVLENLDQDRQRHTAVTETSRDLFAGARKKER